MNDTGLKYQEMPPEFGSRMPHGSCNAVVEGGLVCGFPRRENGTCLSPERHPPPPGWVHP